MAPSWLQVLPTLAALATFYAALGVPLMLVERPAEERAAARARETLATMKSLYRFEKCGDPAFERFSFCKNQRSFDYALEALLRTPGHLSSGGVAAPADADRAQWTFLGCVVYLTQVGSTIGLGSIQPATPWGKLLAIVAVVVGIPIVGGACMQMGAALLRANTLLARALRPRTHAASKSGGSDSPTSGGHGTFGGTSVRVVRPHNRRERLTERPGVVTIHESVACDNDGFADPASSDADVVVARDERIDEEDDRSMAEHLAVLLAMTAVLLFGGAAVFSHGFEPGWSYVEAVYFCFITLCSAGSTTALFPHSPAGRLFLVCYIFVGVGIFASLLGLLTIGMERTKFYFNRFALFKDTRPVRMTTVG